MNSNWQPQTTAVRAQPAMRREVSCRDKGNPLSFSVKKWVSRNTRRQRWLKEFPSLRPGLVHVPFPIHNPFSLGARKAILRNGNLQEEQYYEGQLLWSSMFSAVEQNPDSVSSYSHDTVNLCHNTAVQHSLQDHLDINTQEPWLESSFLLSYLHYRWMNLKEASLKHGNEMSPSACWR